MKIETADLLEFLVKAEKLSILTIFRKSNEGYEIVLRLNWPDGNWHNKSVFVTNDGEPTCDSGDYEFYHMNHILNKMLDEKNQKMKTKEELISKLTDEEKEILGIR